MAHRPTAQDVADLAGVSRSSVSLVLNGRAAGNISAAKQQAVIEAARQLNYRPNTLALSLRSQRSWTIGALTWRGPAGFPENLLHAAWHAATGAGYQPILIDTDDDREHDARAVASLLDRQVDAIVVLAPDLIEYAPSEPLTQVPAALINCFDPELAVTSIVPDEHGASAAAAHALLECGHVRIGLMTDGAATAQARSRVSGAQAALAAAGRPAPELMLCPREIRAGYAVARERLTRGDRPTGLICAHERLALGAVLAAAELRLEIPGDLSMVSLDDGEGLAAGLAPPLATAQRPDWAMVEQAMMSLMTQMSGGEPRPASRITFACPVELRSSVGHPSVAQPSV